MTPSGASVGHEASFSSALRILGLLKQARPCRPILGAQELPTLLQDRVNSLYHPQKVPQFHALVFPLPRGGALLTCTGCLAMD